MSMSLEQITITKDVNIAPVVGFIPDTPYNRIITFLKEYESKNTRDSYLRYYKKMFQYMCNKSIEQLTYADIKSITKDRVKQYRQFLKEEYKPTTINQTLSYIRALWNHFEDENIVADNPFKLKSLKEHENHYGSLTLEEIKSLYEFCLTRKYKPNTQQLYFEFLFIVTCRKGVAQTLTWNKIKRQLDIDTKQMVWVINFVEDNADKGKDSRKSITDEFYNKLRANYENEGLEDNRVFCGLDNSTYANTLKAFCEANDIPQERNIKLHSLKSSGVEFVQDMLGNINITAQAAEHGNIQTTYKRYLNKNKRFTKQPSYMLHKGYRVEMLEGLSKDILLELVKKAGEETIYKMCMELEKMG